MIAAYRELSGDTRVLPGRQYGTCDACGARIEWIRTRHGKMMPQEPNMGEPHFPHCGKNKWTLADWDRHLDEIKQREKDHNSRRSTTNPRRLTQFYSGTIPPWEFQTFMECYET